MTRVLTSRRWQLAWWGSHVIGFGIAAACAPSTSWWAVPALVSVYFTGFLAAVLVEIGTR